MSAPLHPLLALKKAIRDTLQADSALLALLGSAKIYDEVPRTIGAPYISFGDSTVRDQSTVAARSHETLLTLTVWSKQGGSREALAIAGRIEALLHDAALTLTDHRLVNLQLTATETRRPNERETWRVLMKFRAFTEAL